MELDILRIKMIIENIFDDEEIIAELLGNYKRFGRYIKFSTNGAYIIFDLDYNVISYMTNDSFMEDELEC